MSDVIFWLSDNHQLTTGHH